MVNTGQWEVIRDFIVNLEQKFNASRPIIEGLVKAFAESMEQMQVQAQEAARVQAELYPKLKGRWYRWRNVDGSSAVTSECRKSCPLLANAERSLTLTLMLLSRRCIAVALMSM